MKKLFSFLTLFFILIVAHSQTPHPHGSYVQSPDLDRYVGTWKWTSGNEEFTIVLHKQKVHIPDPYNYDVDCLVGWHKYIKNNIIQESSFPNIGLQFDWEHINRATLLGNMNRSNDGIYFTRFWHYVKNKNCNAYLSLLPNSLTLATFKIMNTRGLKSGNFDFTITIPTNITLEKQ